MNAYCPECETDLDQTTGICPACRWDPVIAANAIQLEAPEPEMSLTERYRGTQYDVSLQGEVSQTQTGVSKGRAFVLVGLIAGIALYGVAISAFGIL
jgi:hypothetical protein